jgi:hypothetical protein
VTNRKPVPIQVYHKIIFFFQFYITRKMFSRTPGYAYPRLKATDRHNSAEGTYVRLGNKNSKRGGRSEGDASYPRRQRMPLCSMP